MAFMGLVMTVFTGCTSLDEDSALLPPPSRVCPSLIQASYTPEQQVKKDEVDLFLAGRYEEEGWVILETTQTCSGDIWDWLDSASVPGSEVEPPPLPDIELPPGTELQLTELDLNPELQGPPNSVPMLRPSFGPYVFGDVEASSVEDFIDNEVTSVPGVPQAQDRRYAGINKVVQSLGVQAYINAYNGKVEETIMSVMEIAVVCQGPDPATTLELVGAAVSRDRRNFDTKLQPTKTRFQVEFITPGRKSGWHGTPAKGFTTLRDTPYGPGAVLETSEIGGGIKESLLEIQNIAGTWWVLHNKRWIGYYPSEFFNMMTSEACIVHVYGEVFDETLASWTSSDMGSGLFAEEGFGKAAYFRRPRYRDLAGTFQWPDGAMAATPNDPKCYTSSGLVVDPGLLFDGVFASGPGGDSPDCN
jgi:hypothetical protein